MLYFTSDLHLNHANAIKHTNRPFSCLEEMNQIIIKNINDIVGTDDVLWILGDFSFHASQDEVRYLRERIKCRNVHLVYGNHDKKVDGTGIFQSVQDYKVLKTEYGPVVLFHYPILDWYAKHHGAVHLHGHIHSQGDYNNSDSAKKAFAQFAYGHTAKHPKRSDISYRIYDVGVDANDFRPVSMEEIAIKLQLSKVSPTDEA